MVEVRHGEPTSETISTNAKAEVVKTPKGWSVGHSLTKDDVPAEITREASLPTCPEHQDHPSAPGVGYAGGGYGAYRICRTCGTIFGKVEWKDGENRAIPG